MAQLLASKCRALGASEVLVDEIDTAPGRPNVYALWRSSAPGARWCGIDVHIDTVAVKGMTPYPPFGGHLSADGRLHGRGSCDTKATLANVLSLLEEHGCDWLLQAEGRHSR